MAVIPGLPILARWPDMTHSTKRCAIPNSGPILTALRVRKFCPGCNWRCRLTRMSIADASPNDCQSRDCGCAGTNLHGRLFQVPHLRAADAGGVPCPGYQPPVLLRQHRQLVCIRASARQGSGRIDYHEPNWHLLAPMLEDGAEHDFATSVVLWGDLPSAHADFAPSIVSAIEEMDNRWPA